MISVAPAQSVGNHLSGHCTLYIPQSPFVHRTGLDSVTMAPSSAYDDIVSKCNNRIFLDSFSPPGKTRQRMRIWRARTGSWFLTSATRCQMREKTGRFLKLPTPHFCCWLCQLISARDVIASLLRRLAHRNPNVQLYALTLAESLSKNCGILINREISSRSFTQGLEKLIADRVRGLFIPVLFDELTGVISLDDPWEGSEACSITDCNLGCGVRERSTAGSYGGVLQWPTRQKYVFSVHII